ncbi:hypothetical protein [Rhodoplanes roseus]|uniref:Uncharacterized protein n=1 Tax=Rhodoplanes roseus TaxID=29409 RepID=A0A327KXY1_9BRAD|nr:hypothetical protein [Rhodoplanes roseus]RAI42936.1 hypothetical protein CH341_17020 [Rhodoplanes roseus]
MTSRDHLDPESVFWPDEISIQPCFGCGAVHMDLIDEHGAIGARATFEPAEIDRAVKALLACKRQIERMRDPIGGCDGEA